MGCGCRRAIDEDDVAKYAPLSNQLYLALVLMCKGQALVMIRNVAGNNGFKAWRMLNA